MLLKEIWVVDKHRDEKNLLLWGCKNTETGEWKFAKRYGKREAEVLSRKLNKEQTL